MSETPTACEPRVSITMPAYNAERYIAEAIESILAQTYRSWELIVTDDGSLDHTAEIVEAFSVRDRRIRCIRQKNSGLSVARNSGIKLTTGEFVAFLDADDLWMPEKLALQVQAIVQLESDLIFSDGFLFKDNDTTNESVSFGTIQGRFTGAEIFPLLFTNNRIPILSVLVRRSALDKVKLFNESLVGCEGCEDYDLWMRLAEDGAVFYGMPQHLVRYRRHSGAMTASEFTAIPRMINVLKKHASRPGLLHSQVKRRFRELYRPLLAHSKEEGRLDEARAYAKELSSLDPLGVITLLQCLSLQIAPLSFNFISKQLYRVEWRLEKLRAWWERRYAAR
jgi:glycosyltransferase involved in cell wall biosynthesis